MLPQRPLCWVVFVMIIIVQELHFPMNGNTFSTLSIIIFLIVTRIWKLGQSIKLRIFE